MEPSWPSMSELAMWPDFAPCNQILDVVDRFLEQKYLARAFFMRLRHESAGKMQDIGRVICVW